MSPPLLIREKGGGEREGEEARGQLGVIYQRRLEYLPNPPPHGWMGWRKHEV